MMSEAKKALNARYQAAVDQAIGAGNQKGGEAQKWLASFLKRLHWSSLKSPSLWGFRSEEPVTLPPRLQIALLKSCIDMTVRLRAQWRAVSPNRGKEFQINLDIGGVVYGIANDLFRRRLPFSERDICEILKATHHDCGHGGDVRPPFDLALAHARKHDLSTKLLDALKLYVGGLKGLRPIQVQDVKRKAELLLTLDSASGKQHCWSERFREGLATLPQAQQKEWRAMVVQMDAVEFGRNQKNWKAKAPQIIQTLGAKHILTCLSAWWPSPNETPVCALETGGSYLLQHFVWLLDVIAQEKQHARGCDSLVVQLSKLDWKPRERAQKVMVAAVQYLQERPPAVGWPAIGRLNAWSKSVDPKAAWGGSSIAKALKSYVKKHQLSSSAVKALA
jgi:hypothetical protein